MNIYFEVFLVAGDGASESGASGGVLPCNSNLNVERWQARQGTGDNKKSSISHYQVNKVIKGHWKLLYTYYISVYEITVSKVFVEQRTKF